MASTQRLSREELIGTYYEKMEQVPPTAWLGGMSEYVPSGAVANSYRMTGMVPRLKEGSGPLEAEALTQNEFTIRNKEYKAGLRIPANDLRRDQTGQLAARIADFSAEGDDHFMELLSTLIMNGESALCYTLQPFFSASHVEGDSGTYSNLWAHGDTPSLQVTDPDNPTDYEFMKAVKQIIPKFYAYKDDKGRPRNRRARKFMIMVGTNLMTQAMACTSDGQLDTGSGTIKNPLVGNKKFTLDFDVNPDLTWTNKFVIARVDGNLKPLIRQEEVKVKPDVFGPESEYFRLNDEALIKINTTRSVGYGTPWQMGLATFA